MTESVKKRPANLPLMAVLGALGAVGVGCWIAQVASGAHLLNLNNADMWGLYLVGFMLGTGIAAGSLLLAGASCLFEPFAPLRPYARIAAFVGGIGGTVAAGLFIMADLGSPWRAWEIIGMLHPGSPLFWDTVVLTAYLVIGALFTRQLMAVKRGTKPEKSVKPLAVAAVVAGACVAITSLVFVLQVARPTWNNPGQVASFMLAAFAAAGALLIVVLALLARSGYASASDEAQRRLSAVVAFALLAELVLVAAETAIGAFTGSGEEASVVAWLVMGAGAPFFWAEIVAFAASIVLLMQRKPLLRVAGACCALAAVFLVKYNLLQGQLFNPLLDFAGYPGYSGIVSGCYVPSLLEWGVTVGIVALVTLGAVAGLRKLELGD